MLKINFHANSCKFKNPAIVGLLRKGGNMKNMKFKKIISSPLAEKILFAVALVCGSYFTSLALDRELWKRPTFHIMIFALSVLFDGYLFFILRKILKRKVFPVIGAAARKLFSTVFRRIMRVAERIAGNRSGKVFVDGKEERSFAVGTRERKHTKKRKKLPVLAENASEREKARYAYTVFVFKKDKDIPSSLTPAEVAVRLDKTGEHRDIFTNYNLARYSEEKGEPCDLHEFSRVNER